MPELLRKGRDGRPWQGYVSYARGDWDRGLGRVLTVLQSALDQRLERGSLFWDRASEVESGTDWPGSLENALLASDFLLTVLTPNYFASAWCRREWNTFGRAGRTLVFPILWRETPSIYADDGWQEQVNSYLHADFRAVWSRSTLGPAEVRLVGTFAQTVATALRASRSAATAPPRPPPAPGLGRPVLVDALLHAAHTSTHSPALTLPFAAAASLAVRASPTLLRALRRRLYPSLDTSAEADAWWHEGVAARGPLGVVFDAGESAALLRGAPPAELDAVWSVIREVHRELAETVRVEEELRWRAARGELDAAESLLERLVDTWRSDPQALGTWALQLIDRLPPSLAMRPLAQAFASSVDGVLAHRTLPVPGRQTDASWPWEKVRVDERDLAVDVSWQGSSLRFTRPAATALRLEVPPTEPVVLTVVDGDRRETVEVPLAGHGAVEVKGGTVEVEAVDGRAWRLSREIDPDILDFSTERARHGVVVGRGELVAALNLWLDTGVVPSDLRGIAVRSEPIGGEWMLITGGPCGKSAVVEAALRHVRQPVAFHAFEPTRPETLQRARAERSLVAQLASTLHLELRGLDLRTALQHGVRAAGRVVLMLDGLEHMVREDAATFQEWTLDALPDGVRAIVCADTSPEAWPELVADEGASAAKIEEWGAPAVRLDLDAHSNTSEFQAAIDGWLEAGGFAVERGRTWKRWLDFHALTGARRLRVAGLCSDDDPRGQAFRHDLLSRLGPVTALAGARVPIPVSAEPGDALLVDAEVARLALVGWGEGDWLRWPATLVDILRSITVGADRALAGVLATAEGERLGQIRDRHSAALALDAGIEGLEDLGPWIERAARSRRIEALCGRLSTLRGHSDLAEWARDHLHALTSVLRRSGPELRAHSEDAIGIVQREAVSQRHAQAASLLVGPGLLLREPPWSTNPVEGADPPKLGGFTDNGQIWSRDGRIWSWSGGWERPVPSGHFAGTLASIGLLDPAPIRVEGRVELPDADWTAEIPGSVGAYARRVVPGDWWAGYKGDVNFAARDSAGRPERIEAALASRAAWLRGSSVTQDSPVLDTSPRLFAGLLDGTVTALDRSGNWTDLGQQDSPVRELVAIDDVVYTIDGQHVRVWADPPTGRPAPEAPPEPPAQLLVSPEGWLFALSSRGALSWLNPETGRWRASKGELGAVSACGWALHEGRRILVAGNATGEVKTLLVDRSGRVPKLRSRHGAPVTALACAPDGIATGAEDGTVHVGALSDPPTVYTEHAGPVRGLLWRGGELWSVADDGRVIARRDAKVVADHRAGGNPVTALVRDGDLRVGFADGTELSYEAMGHVPLTSAMQRGPTVTAYLSKREPARMDGRREDGAWIVVAQPGAFLLSTGHIDTTKLGRAEGARADSDLAGHGFGGLAWIDRAGKIARLPASSAGVATLARARSLAWRSEVIVAGSDDGALSVFDPQLRFVLASRLAAHTLPITGVAVLSDSRLVSCSLDRTVRVWDTALRPIATFRGPSAFTRIVGDGTEIYAGDWAGRLWPLQLREGSNE